MDFLLLDEHFFSKPVRDSRSSNELNLAESTRSGTFRVSSSYFFLFFLPNSYFVLFLQENLLFFLLSSCWSQLNNAVSSDLFIVCLFVVIRFIFIFSSLFTVHQNTDFAVIIANYTIASLF